MECYDYTFGILMPFHFESHIVTEILLKIEIQKLMMNGNKRLQEPINNEIESHIAFSCFVHNTFQYIFFTQYKF